MKREWDGWYLDGRTAERVKASVAIGPDALIIRAGGPELEWPYKEVRQTSGFYDGEDVRLARGAEALIVKDPEFLSAVAEHAPARSRRFHDPKTRKRRRVLIPAAAILSVAAVAVIYFWIIPALSMTMAERIPPSWEARLGDSVAESFTSGMAECEDERMRGAVSGIMERLEKGAGDTPYTFNVKVVDFPLVNAFALPGGRIIVFSGLIEETGSPEELAGVLAHEMEHVLLKHATKGIFERYSTYMLFSMMTGDLSGAASIARSLGEMRYSRLHEKEADLLGAELLISSGIDPGGLASFFEKMDEKKTDGPKALNYVSTHPMPEDRAGYIKEAIDKEGAPVATPLLPGVDWDEVSGACGRDIEACGEGQSYYSTDPEGCRTTED